MALSRDDFEEWLIGIDDRVEALHTILPPAIARELDYSPRSLDLLEEWLLSRYPSTRALLEEAEKESLDYLSTYVGETFRKNLGGVWNIDLENRKNAYFNIPVLEEKGKWVECPVTLTTAAADRRTGHFLSHVLQNNRERNR